MRFKFLARAAAIFLLAAPFAIPAILAAPQNGPAQQSPEANPQAAAIPTYPESAEGLKNLLQDWFAAIKAGDAAKSAQYLESFAIPNHQEWFVKTFGTIDGARLEDKYTDPQGQPLDWLKESAARGVKAERFLVEVSVFDKPSPTDSRSPLALLAAMVQPAPIYEAVNPNHSNDNRPNFLGYFVYVDSGFRYFDSQLVRALSSASPKRIMIGGNVAAAKLINHVPPIYPPEAKDSKIQGTVILHVIIGTDGSVQQLAVVSGHPVLLPAAIEAVSHWRYQPVTLNGELVEVDTQINIIFSLAQ